MASRASPIETQRRIAIVTSIHPDFDARIWKHACSMASAGWQVDLIAPWVHRDEQIPDGVTLHPFARVTSRLRRPVLIPLRIARRLLPLLRSCDIVHFHDIDILPWMSLLSLVQPTVYDVHEDYPEEMLIREWVPGVLRKPFALMLEVGQRLFARPIRNVVLTQPELEAEFPGAWFRREFIYNYATVRLAEGRADDYLTRQPTVVFIGSQHTNNGSDLLIEIAARVAKERPQVKFLASDRFANAGLRSEAIERMKRLGATSMEFIPNVRPHELMSVLNRATIAISPNLRVKQQIRGAHNKTYEFMAAGLPIVLSDLPRQVEAVGKSECGILAQPEDVESFVRAVIRLVDDPGEGQRLGQNGVRAFREKYSWESQMPRLLALYDHMLGGRPQRGTRR
jgi:glycosyltransferase involved in cell wall biosynthesis